MEDAEEPLRPSAVPHPNTRANQVPRLRSVGGVSADQSALQLVEENLALERARNEGSLNVRFKLGRVRATESVAHVKEQLGRATAHGLQAKGKTRGYGNGLLPSTAAGIASSIVSIQKMRATGPQHRHVSTRQSAKKMKIPYRVPASGPIFFWYLD
eukprot:6741093-Pyramimonas_sp.AAC.1